MIFTIHSGSLGVTGSVGWMFDRKGAIQVRMPSLDDALELALEVGAEDAVDLGGDQGDYELLTDPSALHACREALAARQISIEHCEVRHIAKQFATEDPELAQPLSELVDTLEQQDDVVRVSHNYVWPSSE